VPLRSKHVEAWNKLIVKQKFCASSWLITEIKILRCTVSKTSKRKKKKRKKSWYPVFLTLIIGLLQLPSVLFFNLCMFLWLSCAIYTLDWRNVQCMDPVWSIVNLKGYGHPNLWAKLVGSENIDHNIRREVAGYDVQQLSVCLTIFTSHRVFFNCMAAPSGPRLPHCQGFTVTLS